ncbi:MAG TPA: ABC transporter ATP-binding protein [Chloroflexota bacterium]|nr:ABC transporter ATP-binding protein [Chloroflexota bacterium]
MRDSNSDAERRGGGPAALVVEKLSVRVGPIEAVHDLSFVLEAGQRTGLIGESGSGKTLTALAIMGLLPDGLSATGRVLYKGRDLLAMSERDLCAIRGDRLAMIFQEPMTALNPVMQIGAQVAEPLRLHRQLRGSAARSAALQALERVKLPDPAAQMHAYPHQLSGGQRQRAMIAMATACSPAVLLADEPTTALDVTVQAQILDLLVGLVEERGSSLLLITHDLPVVANVCQRVLVLYGGHIVETGSVDEVFSDPRHPYTRALLDAIPPLDDNEPSRKLPAIPGTVPGLGEFPPGCPFRNRCPRADAACMAMPPLDERVACWHPLA